MPVGSAEIGPDFHLQVTHFEPYVRTRQGKRDTATGEMRMQTIFQGQNRFQIVSAGFDRKIGKGGLWPLRFPDQTEDRDNLTNFAEWRLETGR